MIIKSLRERLAEVLSKHDPFTVSRTPANPYRRQPAEFEWECSCEREPVPVFLGRWEMMETVAGPEDFPVTSGPAACPARLEDCRCGQPAGHLGDSPHRCEVPGCGALWYRAGILRLPSKTQLRHLRAVA